MRCAHLLVFLDALIPSACALGRDAAASGRLPQVNATGSATGGDRVLLGEATADTSRQGEF